MMGEHLIDGEFQSDKYPTCPRGKVPLSCKDPMAQDLLWQYARRRRSVDAQFSDDLEEALRLAGFAPPPPEFIDGTCEWCGHEGEVFRDNKLCEECDSDTVHCSVCDETVHLDHTCRHVFKTDDGEWTGSGAYTPSGHVKAPFFLLLARMPAGFAPALREAVRAGKFHTWMVAPLIGGGGVLTLHGMPGGVVDWGERLIEVGESDAAEGCADGYRWLASLYDGDTPTANRLTIEWLDEWLGGIS